MWSKFTKFLSSWTKGLRIRVIETRHFQERLLQRFTEEDLPRVEGALKKAFEKAKPGQKLRYTHPYYEVTVVVQKIGTICLMQYVICIHKSTVAKRSLRVKMSIDNFIQSSTKLLSKEPDNIQNKKS